MTAPMRLYLVDGSGYIFRAYHALPALTRKSDGLPTGAVAGYCNMLFKLLADMHDEHEPTHFAVVFDHSEITFRNEIYPDYKANRPDPPEDLRPQFPLVREATRAFNAPCIEVAGFEADDIIASYARAAAAMGGEVVIISSDKDLMQLVGDRVSMLDTMKNRKIGRNEVIEKFGVPPEKVVDVQALAGDSVDNVPGVPGIGVKTAAQLILEYGDLDTLLARAGEIRQEKRRQALIEHADAARISRKLVELKADMKLPVPFDDIVMPQIVPEKLIPFLRKMEFSTLTKRVEEKFKVKVADGAAPAAGEAARSAAAASPAAAPFDRARYLTIYEPDRLADFLAKAYERGALAIQALADQPEAMRARVVGFALCIAPGAAAYVPLAHGAEGLTLEGAGAAGQMSLEAALERLKPVLADPSILKIGHNIKADALVLERLGARIASFDDVMLISYALDCGKAGHGLEELSTRSLGYEKLKLTDICGSGRAQLPLSEIDVARAAEYAAETAEVIFRLHGALKPRLAAEGLAAVYETLERPMPPVVAAMEREGIKIDPAVLARLSADFARRMRVHEEEAYRLAGGPFNMGSAKQVSDILFGKLQLPGARKTPTGAWSTKADILEELAAEGHALPRALLNWRGLSKLKSTYTDSLPLAVNAETGRIHTSFALAATTTGRLSSNDPNLQNIPIRTEDGAKIRDAFVAEKGNVLISADYSQIELRLLAHIADLKSMKKAFADGVDIHAMTASEMFGVPVAGMDPMVRRRAKAINFGIIYGISAFGLANQLGISRGEAKDYISSYFQKFPGIKAYMDETVRGARERGYVETIFGRRTHVGAINDKNPALRGYAERQAINAPIQGAAADIIRRAMIRIPVALAENGLKARMLLQVHDELIFEAPEAEAAATIAVVTRLMAKAPLPAVSLSVPLVVEARAGKNWGEAH
jgi:DNA polymerase-1